MNLINDLQSSEESCDNYLHICIQCNQFEYLDQFNDDQMHYICWECNKYYVLSEEEYDTENSNEINNFIGEKIEKING